MRAIFEVKLMAVARKEIVDNVEEHLSGDPRFKLVDRALKRFQYRQDALLEVLHTAQEAFGHLSEDLLIYTARQLKLPFSWVYGVATFYHFFSLEPQGEHTCIVCTGTACYVKKAGEIVDQLAQEFNIEAGETTADGKFSLSTARCLGSCGLAPVLVVDGNVVGREGPEAVLERIKTLLANGAGASQPAGLAEQAQEIEEEEV